MQILQSCKSSLAYIGLTNDQSVHIFGLNLSRWFIRSFIIFGHLLVICLEFTICFGTRSSDYTSMLFSLHVGVSFISVLLIYINLMVKTDEIVKLMEYLWEVIDMSEFCIMGNCDVFSGIRGKLSFDDELNVFVKQINE